jgi:hypothetical protein
MHPIYGITTTLQRAIPHISYFFTGTGSGGSGAGLR